MALPSYGGPVSNGASAAPAPNPLFQRVQEFLAARNNRLPGNLSEPVSHAPIDVGIHGFGPGGAVGTHPIGGPVRGPFPGRPTTGPGGSEQGVPFHFPGVPHAVPGLQEDLQVIAEHSPLQQLLHALIRPESSSSRAVHGRNKALVGHNAMRLPNY